MSRRRTRTPRRLLPAPLLSAALFVLWMLLVPALDAANLALAALLAFGVPVLCAPLRPLPLRMKRPLTVLRLVGVVGYDVLLSNVEVAWGVLRLGNRRLRPAFVTIPLDIREPHALAALATITTVVPGTVWCELAGDCSAMRLHVFDLPDEAAFVAWFKARYEQPLKEIFE